MSLHAKLSPSAAKRWLNCPGSVALCESAVDYSSDDAEHGTACHALLEEYLNGGSISSLVGMKAPNGWEYTTEMLGLVTPLAEWLDQYRTDHDAALFAESKVSIGGVFGLHEAVMWGTVDCIGVSDELLIFDAKFGYVDVPVKDNPQLILYALGTMHGTGYIHDQIRLVIGQPRAGEPKEYVYTAEELVAWAGKNTPAVLEAASGAGELRPSEDACRWCKAQAVCPALRSEVMALAKREMSSAITLSPAEIGELLSKGEMVETALRAVRAHAIKLMELGTEIPGWKRVTGEKHRTWRNEGDAAQQIKSLDLDPWEKKIKTPAAVEEELAKSLQDSGNVEGVGKTYYAITEKKMRVMNGKPSFTACKVVANKAVGIAGAYKPDGEPTLAKTDDPRPALPPSFTAEEVKMIEESETTMLD